MDAVQEAVLYEVRGVRESKEGLVLDVSWQLTGGTIWTKFIYAFAP